MYSRKEISRALVHANFSRKVLEYRAAEQSAPLRSIFKRFIVRFSARQLVFLDETGGDPNTRRRYGLSRVGSPAFLYVRNSAHGKGRRCMAIAALSLQGILSQTVLEENINREVFLRVLEIEVSKENSNYFFLSTHISNFS